VLVGGAKCIENDSLRRNASGDWVITGEIHNETDVQGLDMLLAGRIEFPGGATREQQAYMCPRGTLSPGTFSVYTIAFPGTSSLPRPVRYSVNVSSGRASGERLRTLPGQFSDVNASRPAPGADTVSTAATFTLENREQARIRTSGGAFYNACIVLYSDDGDVVRTADTTQSSVFPGDTTLFVNTDFFGVAPDAAEARVFFYLTDAGGTPITAPRISDLVPIIDPTQ
jgi:hypothetical protein